MIVAPSIEDLKDFTRSQLVDFNVEAGKSSQLFAETFFPHIFVQKFSDLHIQVFNYLDALDRGEFKRFALMAPRGIGKTTCIGAFLTRQIVYRRCNYIAMASASVDLAEKDSDAIKSELITNEMLKLIAGIMNPKVIKVSDYNTEFSKKQWVTSPLMDNETKEVAHWGTRVTPMSWHKKIRGAFHQTPHGRFRPDVLNADDMDNPEEVRSDIQRGEMKRWFNSDFRNLAQKYERAIGPKEFPYIAIVTGTMMHDDCLIATCIESSDWESLKLSICDEELNSLAPLFISTEEIKVERQKAVDSGNLNQWCQEYLGEAMDSERAAFKQEFFRYYEPKDLFEEDGTPKHLESVVLIDPAKTKEAHNSDTAIVGVSYAPKENKIYGREIIHTLGPVLYEPDGTGELQASDALHEVFRMAQRISSPGFNTKIVYETSGLNLYIEYPLRIYANLYGYEMFELIGVNAQGDKDDRIMHGLGPLYRSGRMLHPAGGGFMILESQLIRMPASKKKDVADAASMIAPVLTGAGRLFSSHKAARSQDFERKMLLRREELSRRMGQSRRVTIC